MAGDVIPRNAMRRMRVRFKQLIGREPALRPSVPFALDFFGTEYGGWPVVRGSLGRESVIVDIGLGEDLSFPEALVERYGCAIYGFDPTPRSIAYVNKRSPRNFTLFEFGVAAADGDAVFHLPNDADHVSGSLFESAHLGRESINVKLIAIERVAALIGTSRIDLLKMDIEGAEFEVVEAPGFAATVASTKQICIEFHHRWPRFGKASTVRAVRRLQDLGFEIAWVSDSNEEVLFVRTAAFA